MGEVVRLMSHQPVLFALTFDCLRCGHHVYAAVHLGHRRMCLDCQYLEPEVSLLVNKPVIERIATK
jgi:transcription elongation factor Elf1